MTPDKTFLAGYGQPGAPMTEYSAHELHDPACVEELFDYCQILQGVITAAGWRYLLDIHGLDALLAIDRRSGWLDADQATAPDALKYQCLIAGYDPEADRFGSYDESFGVFTTDQGQAREISWAHPWTPGLTDPTQAR